MNDTHDEEGLERREARDHHGRGDIGMDIGMDSEGVK
jgi:hypothetical protein